MNFRLTAILFGVVTLLLVGLLVSVLTHDPNEDRAGGRVLASLVEFGISPETVKTIRLTRTEPAAGELIFTKTDTGWVQTAPTNAKLEQAEVQGLLRGLFDLKATAFSGVTENLTTQGLNPPTLRVTLTSQDDRDLTVNFGRTTIGGADKAVTFVTTSSAPERPFAVRRADLDGLFRTSPTAPSEGLAGPMAKWSGDYRLRRFLGESRDPANELTQVKIVGGGKAIELAKARGGWRFLAPVGYGPADEAGDTAPQAAAAPFTGVRPLILALANLNASPDDFVESPDPAVTGLGDSSAIRVTFTGPRGTEEVVVGKQVVGPDGKPVAPAKVYVQVPGESGAAQVTFDRLNSLWATLDAPQSLRDRNLLPPTERERLDAIDLIVGTNVVKLRRVPVTGGPPQWVVYGGPSGPVAAKADPVSRLVENLTRPRAGQEMQATLSDPKVTGPALQATVKAWANAVPAGESKLPPGKFPEEPVVTGPPTVELALGQREVDRVYARGTIGDTKADYKLPESLVNLALLPRLAWVDPKFTSFNRAKAETISFSREGTAYTLQKTNEVWSFTQPERLKGVAADGPRIMQLLDQLASITAQTVLAEKPTAEELQRAKLDLVAPRLQVTVTLQDDATKKLVYEFGTDTEDGQAVYFRQMGIPMLTRADRRPLDTLLGSDLRDRTIFRLDPAQVSQVQLRGRMGQPTIQTVILERSGTAWTTRTPNLTLDPAKVNQLVALLAAPKCEQFVGSGKAEFGTDITQNATAIEIVVDRTNGPPVSLVLGATVAGSSNLVYGASSAIGESFTLNADPFRPLVTTPTGLAK